MKYFKLDRSKTLEEQVPGGLSSWSNEGIIWHGNDNYLQGEFSGSHESVLDSLPEIDDRKVTSGRFKNQLLGMEIYGGLRVARVGLQAKFQNGMANDQDVSDLVLLEAMDGMTQGDEINLLDSSLGMVLDFAVRTPKIGYFGSGSFIKFDESHKERVILDTPIAM